MNIIFSCSVRMRKTEVKKGTELPLKDNMEPLRK